MHFKFPYKVNPLPDENDDPEINIIKDSMNDDDVNYVDLDENGEELEGQYLFADLVVSSHCLINSYILWNCLLR